MEAILMTLIVIFLIADLLIKNFERKKRNESQSK